MYKIYIEKIHRLFELENQITSIRVENPILFRDIYKNIAENIVFSSNDKAIGEDNIYILYDPLNFEINSKKNINLLYKLLAKNSTQLESDKLEYIKTIAIDIVDSLSNSTNFLIDYDLDITFSKLFNLIKLEFKFDDSDDFINNFLNLLEVLPEIMNLEILVTFNLCSLIIETEYQQILEKARENNIKILNFSLETNDFYNYAIDFDLCVV